MAALIKSQRERFAQGIARGMNTEEAARAAGYRAPRNCRTLDQKPDIAARVQEIRDGIACCSRDLRPIIVELKLTALAARELKSAAGMMASKAALTEAARLKQLLSDDGDFGRVAPDSDEDLSDEEWIRLYGPPAPGNGVN